MTRVFCWRCPFEVFEAIIELIDINVINIRFVFWIGDKSLSYNNVDVLRLLFSVLCQIHYVISRIISERRIKNVNSIIVKTFDTS